MVGLELFFALGSRMRGKGSFGLIGVLRCFMHGSKCLKKNQNAPRPSEHPLVRGENMSKRVVTGYCCPP